MDASTLFKLASALNAVSIPGHLLMGFAKVYPAMRTIKREEHEGALAGARNSWDNVHVLLFINAILNYQWSQSGGPKTTGEKTIVLVMFLAGLAASMRYFRAREYGALGCMFVAPSSALLGMLIAG